MKFCRAASFVMLAFLLLFVAGAAVAVEHDLPPGRGTGKTQREKTQRDTDTPKRPKGSTKKKNVAKKSSSYNVLNSWNLAGARPYVVLRTTNGDNLSLVFAVNGNVLELPDEPGAIPANTRFTVPNGYVAYCDPYDTKMIKGKAQRVDYAQGVVKHRYEANTEVEYIAASGLILVAYADLSPRAESAAISQPNTSVQVSTLPEPVPEPKKAKTNFNNRSVNPDDVIKTYGLPAGEANFILRRHKEIAKMLSKKEKAEEYANLFAHYSGDYLAAYYAGLAEFESGHGSRAKEWLEKSLNINPQYLPAKMLMKQANGLEKGM